MAGTFSTASLAIMKHLIGIAICIALFSAHADACSSAPPNVKDASSLFLGYATGLRQPDLEAEYLGGESANVTGMARGYPLLLVRVAQTESLKGRAPKIVEATSPCALPIVIGDKVLVAQLQGEFVAYPADFLDSVEAVREALRDR